ncbi:MAG TPA: TolC family protein [Parafilimonas sp.]|nr:TolC family protein [Parafilimonas sp.]
MKKYFITFTLLYASIMATAQTQVSNELKGIINQSFSYYPKVQEAKNQINIAEKQIDVAQTKLPTVDLNGSYEYVQPKIVLPLEVDGEKTNFQFAPVNNVNANIGAEYLLFDFGRLKANVDKAKTDLKYANDNVANVQTLLASQVAGIYYNIIYFRKAVTIEDSILNYLNANKTVAANKLKNGDAIKLDVLNLQSQIDIEVNLREDLLNNLQRQITLLQYTTGNNNIAGNSFDFNLPVQTLQDAFATASVSAPDFLLAQDRIQQAKDQLNIVRQTDKPSVALNGSAGVKNGYVPEVTQMRFNYAGGVSLKIPLYDGRTKKQIAVAEAQVKQNQLAQESLNNEYQNNIQQALTDIQTNTDKLKNMQGQIETGMEAVKIASSRYLNGIGLNTDITDAVVNLQRVLLTNLRYQYQLATSKVEYARVTGYRYW